MRPIIGITMGDPVGIGPEITVKALAETAVQDVCRPLVIGDAAILASAMKITGCPLEIHEVDTPEDGLYRPGILDLLPASRLQAPPTWGAPDTTTGRAMVDYILKGIDLALEGKTGAIVTGPINKYAMNLSGHAYNGHTELLAERTRTSDYAMMMAGDVLRVTLVTIHTAIASVPKLVTMEKVRDTIALTYKTLVERFGIPTPAIAVAGLNPHAGEEDMFGDEETTRIRPAVEAAQAMGIDARGPFPPDTLFVEAGKGRYDAVIAMYHDQGLIPFKMRHFDDGVNTTLGLPIIRTSVDHGTAYPIAGSGTASHESLVAAIRMAAHQAVHWKKSPLAGHG